MTSPKIHNVGNCTIEERSGTEIGGRDACDIAASDPKSTAMMELGCGSAKDSIGCAVAGKTIDVVTSTKDGKELFKKLVRTGCRIEMNMFRFKQNGKEVLNSFSGKDRLPEALAACVLEKPIKNVEAFDKKMEIPKDYRAKQKFLEGNKVVRFFRALGVLIGQKDNK